jgi:Outer membrane protein beta-barrel domain
MKKIIMVLLTTGSTVVAVAQVQFGVKAAYNLTSLMVSDLPSGSNLSFNSKSDFSAGVLASLPLSTSFSLQPELMYSGQGAKTTVQSSSATLNYSYLNVPVLFKYLHMSGLFVETGPQIGFLLSAKENSNGQSADIKSNSQTIDFSWAFGIGYKIPDMGLGIDARYNLGLTNIAKNNTGTTEGTIKNSVFQIGLFYMFGNM